MQQGKKGNEYKDKKKRTTEKETNGKENKRKKRRKQGRNKERTTLSQPLYLLQDICFIVAYAQVHALVIPSPADYNNQPGLEAAARLGSQRPDVPGSFTNEG